MMSKEDKKEKKLLKRKKDKTKSKKVEIEELEIIDVFDEVKEQKKRAVVKKRKLKKGLLFQTIFCTLSIIFIIGCCVFYGSRLIKYYKIYNPKDENGNKVALLVNQVMGEASFVYEGEGLYTVSGSYIYKGVNLKNYVNYAGFTWRIIRINDDRSLELILDNPINLLKWNNEVVDFSKSDVNKYLNDVFVKYLNTDYLNKTSYCSNVIDDITKIKCDTFEVAGYVRLLSIDEFLNSKVEDKSYISNEGSIWLSTRGEDKVWTINGDNLSYAEVGSAYNIKPVITLKSTVQTFGGNGSKEKPYLVEKETEKITIGSKIKLGDDIWTVYAFDKDSISLSLNTLYEDGTKTFRFDAEANKYNPENKYSLAEYLNKEYLETLSYKDKILDTEWNTGEYKESYTDIQSDKVTAKVGLLSIADFKNDELSNYYLLNGTDSKVYYVLENDYVLSKPVLSRAIRPAIRIKNTTIKEGNGSLDNPYVLED